MARKAAFSTKTTKATTKTNRAAESSVMTSLPLEPTFFDGISIRETIESIAVAIILAMVFKTLEAEAYVIPTGSMAPTLMGQHVEVECDQCHYWFQTGAVHEGPSGDGQGLVTGVRCPMCSHDQTLTRKGMERQLKFLTSDYNPNEESFSGDRIVVSKVEYIFREPERWDVIVFKFPGNGKQNYIKRLVGLPNEELLINNGDVYIRAAEDQDVSNDDPDSRAKLIERKPGYKLAAIMIPVKDTHYFSPLMRQAGLPPSWLPWQGDLDVPPSDTLDDQAFAKWVTAQNHWEYKAQGDAPATFELSDGSAEGQKFHWLRFRNLLPGKSEWDTAQNGGQLNPGFLENPGTPVTDYYCYSDSNEHFGGNRPTFNVADMNRLSGNWVGDLIMEADVQIESSSGTLALDAVEGGIHYLCTIDIASGKATLQTQSAIPQAAVMFSDGKGAFNQQAIQFATSIRGAGQYQLRFANVDDRVLLWVNGAEVEMPGEGHYSRRGPLYPVCLPKDPADAQPLGIGFSQASAKISRLKVFRDLFYNDYVLNSVKDTNLAAPLRTVQEFFLNPKLWSEARFQRLYAAYDSRSNLNWDRSFVLGEDQFFPLGDNSPSSQDARVWDVDHWVERKMLIGKALMVYWPHTWNSPPFWPNFGRIRVIR